MENENRSTETFLKRTSFDAESGGAVERLDRNGLHYVLTTGLEDNGVLLFSAASSMCAMAWSTGPEKLCCGTVLPPLAAAIAASAASITPSPLECGDLQHLAAQLAGQLLEVDAVAVLAHQVHHVDGDDHGDAELGELRRQIEVAL